MSRRAGTMKPVQIAQILFIIAASLGVYSFVRAAQSDHRRSSCQALCHMRPAYAGRERRVPDFELPDASGKMVRFSSFLGKAPVVLNFWTKSCRPCLEEMPSLAEMAEIMAEDGVKVVTICTDEGPDAVKDVLQVALKGKPPPFVILYDPDSKVVGDMFGTTLFPETWLIDQQGVIRVRIDGAKDWSQAMQREAIEMIGKPSSCALQFDRGSPINDTAGLCDNLL